MRLQRLSGWVLVLQWLILITALAQPAEYSAGSAGSGYRQAMAEARERLAQQPGDSGAWQQLGEALAAVGEYPEAISAHEQAVEAGGEPRLSARVAAARLGLRFGDREASEQTLQAVLSEYQGDGSGLSAAQLVALAEAAVSLAPANPRYYAQALDLYELAIQRDPADVSARVGIGDLLLDRYNSAEAMEAYGEALTLNDSQVGALFGMARVHHFNHSPLALEVARRGLELEPDHVGSRVLLARLHVELEDYEQGERQAQRALDVNPQAPDALAILAAVSYLREDQEAFDATIERVRRFPANRTQLYVTLAEIAARNRRYADAVGFALYAAELDPQAWRAHALAGMNRLRTGDIKAGRRSLETAFRGDPFDLWTKNTLDLLDRTEDYETVTSNRFVLVAQAREAQVLAPHLLPLAERAYERLAERYGHRPATPIRVELYERHEDFSVRTVGLAGIDILGVSFGPVVALDSPSSKVFGDFHWGSALWHELAHTFHLDISASRVPRWFSEGLAVHEEHAAKPGWGAAVTPDFLRAFHQGVLPSISSLNQAFLRPSYPDQMLHAYFQSSLLMSLIERDHGFDAINQMLRGYRTGKTTAELTREVLGLEPEALDVAFDHFVRQRYQHALDAIFGPRETADAEGEVATYDELMSNGRAALEAQALDRAEQLFLQAQGRFPEHAGPGSSYRQLATLYRQRGQTEAAENQLRKAIALRGDDLSAHGELANLYLETENGAAAAAVLEQSLMIEPFDPEVHARLAEIHEQQQAWVAATRERAAVVALDPADPVEERLRLAKVLNRSGDTTAARHEVLRVLEAAPLYDDALELLLEVRANQSAPKGTDLFGR